MLEKLFNLFTKILKKIKLILLVKIINDLHNCYEYKRLSKYFRLTLRNISVDNKIKNSKNIWVFWWQGEEQMPPIVKACYNSVLKHANGHRVVLITKDNYKEYTNIDDNILDKLNKKYISLTAFSDVMRFNLLKNNGGLWIDATVYLTEDIKEEYFEKIFTVGINDKYHDSVNGGYSGFLMGGCNNEIIEFMNLFFINYYKYNDYVHYYFMIDVALNCCYKNNIDGFKNYVDDKSFNSDPTLHSLAPMLNDNYDKESYDKIYNRFFKLTYKMDFDDNHDTFYHRIIHNIEPFSN